MIANAWYSSPLNARYHWGMVMPMLAGRFRHHYALAAVFAWAGSTAVLAAEHTLMPTPQTVHIGHFLALLKPVLSIDSGDIVTIESTASIVPSVVDASGVVPPLRGATISKGYLWHRAGPRPRSACVDRPDRD